MPTLRGKFRDYKLAQYKRKVNNLSSNKEKLGGRNIRKQRERKTLGLDAVGIYSD